MSDILTDTSPVSIVAALEANWRAYRRSWGRHPSVEIRDDERFFWFITGQPSGWINAVLRADLSPDEADDAIRATIDHFTRRGVPWLWVTGPSSAPPDLPERLVTHGLQRSWQCPGMALVLPEDEIAIPPVAGLAIQPLDDAADIDQWGQIYAAEEPGHRDRAGTMQDIQAASMDYPGKRYYLGLLDGEPVAAAILLLAEGVAGIYGVATVPEARGSGIGTAMTWAALRDGQQAGYRVATLQASRSGFNLYQRMGFTVCHRFDVFAPAE
jgi:ribosomal protein S18 acetylase RimI-like enzyme